MKTTILKFFFLSIGLSIGTAFTQCPGTTSTLGLPSTGVAYNIDATHPKCGVDGAIDVTVPGGLPATTRFFWSVDGGDYVEFAAVDLDIIPAAPGDYSFVVIDFLATALDQCNFTIVDSVTCPGDYDGDGYIGTSDLLLFLGEYGDLSCIGCCGDFDGDGAVGAFDLITFLGNFDSFCTDTLAPLPTTEYDSKNRDEEIQALIDQGQISNPVQIDIYPNPSAGDLNVSIENLPPNTNLNDIVIVDMTGRIVQNVNWNVESKITRTNINNLDPGTYFITVATETGKYLQRFIVN